MINPLYFLSDYFWIPLYGESFLQSLPATCPNPAAEASIPNDCGFYKDCLEATFNCGEKGYPIGYGYKYCNRFLEEKHRFSKDGQKWIDGTLTCLKEALVDTIEHPDGKTCDDVNTIAFNSHVGCYVKNGFCDLACHPSFYRDLMHVYDFRDFFSKDAMNQVSGVFVKCTQCA